MGRAKVKPPKGFFLRYQQRWIEDQSRIKAMEKARQIGISWATSFRQTRETAMDGAVNDVWVSSRDDLQAQLFIDDCKYWLPVLKGVAEDLGLVVVDPDTREKAKVLEFANGRRLISLSSNYNAQAGKRGTRVLDEFALHPDPRQLYAIALPGITWGGQLEIISTHRGSQNFFNVIIREIREGGNPKKISLHRVTLEDALNDGFLAKLQAKLPKGHEVQEMDEAEYFKFVEASCADRESFLQEFMCQPADDNAAFLEYDLIGACEYAEGVNWEWKIDELRKSANPLFLGVDIGRTEDLTVLWLIERTSGVHFTRHLVTMKNTRFGEQEKILWDLLDLPGLRRACIDSTGLGRQMAERAQERLGAKVEPVNFTAQIKEELAYTLRGVFEKGAARIPSDRHVRADLRAVKKTVTTAGNIRFAADRGPGGHADRFWALALALHAAKDAGTNYGAVLV